MWDQIMWHKKVQLSQIVIISCGLYPYDMKHTREVKVASFYFWEVFLFFCFCFLLLFLEINQRIQTGFAVQNIGKLQWASLMEIWINREIRVVQPFGGPTTVIGSFGLWVLHIAWGERPFIHSPRLDTWLCFFKYYYYIYFFFNFGDPNLEMIFGIGSERWPLVWLKKHVHLI